MPHIQVDHHRLLLDALINPDYLIDYSVADWELLLRLARKVKLLGRIAMELNKRNLLEKIPVRAVNLLRSGLIQAKRLQQLSHWELNRVLWALQVIDVPIIVLKGVAYSLAGLPESEGRVYVDLDLMVPEDELGNVESVLTSKGWQFQQLSAYDEYYYRVWSHEIPPLIHIERETEVDIHHTIAPLTSQLKINTDLLFEAAVPVDNDTKVKILSPVDMVIHCAVNLFQNNELADDLRDLLDFHDLLLFFGSKEEGFWEKLTVRANQLRLSYILFYALYFSNSIFRTIIPGYVFSDLDKKPGRIKLWIMHQTVPLALFPQHPDKPSRTVAIARTLMYLRSHWIRMPLYLLIPHLAYKTFLAVFPKKAASISSKKK
jgi:putative nucleotidyltransferase-like protein